MTRTTMTATFLAFSLLIAAQAARADDGVDSATQDRVRIEMTAQGYDVRRSTAKMA